MTTITVVGGNLFAIAAQQLGDATQWIRIAQANGLTDPMLSGLATLVIPDPDPSQTGGLPQQ
jgi:L-ascorbate metabolism protein UlaG (beta-lactamase superfamily)